MDCSTPGFPVLHYLLEFAQTQVHWVSDAIQPSHSLSPPFSPALNLSQHQSFPMSQFFPSGGLSIGASASAAVLPMNIQGWFPLGLTGLISLLFKGLSRVFCSTTVWKHQFLWPSAFIMVQLSHPYMTTGKTIALTVQTFVGNVMSLFFNMLSRFVIAFLPRSKRLLMPWLQSSSCLPGGSVGKESTCNAGATGDTGSTPGLERSSGEGHGNPLQYSCLKNPMDRGAWQGMVHRVTKSQTPLKWLRTITIHSDSGAKENKVCHSWNSLAFSISNRCWQLDLWILCFP